MLRRPALVLPLAAVVLTACGEGGTAGADAAGDGDGALAVTAGFYPYAYVAERVGGDAVRVVDLSAGAGEAHDVELTAQQAAQVSESDLVVYSPGLQPALDEVVEQQARDRALDVLDAVPVRTLATGASAGSPPHGQEGHEHVGEDPHVWLDPDRLATIGQAVAERLGELDPARAEAFGERAAALRADLVALDTAYRDGLASCERRELVSSHDAFGYLTERYDLEQVPVSGLDGEQEPSARRLAEVAETARERGVTTIFFEDVVTPRVAEQLAREVGAEARALPPLETQPEQGDYLGAMRANLGALRAALGCA